MPSARLHTATGPTSARFAPPNTILDAIGHTPVVALARLAHHLQLPAGTGLWGKAEFLNPGGSGKDRLALALLQAARRAGLQPGQTVVEASSGNTGIALAQACAILGHPLHVVSSLKVSREKICLMEAYGATVHRTPNVPHGHPDHYIPTAKRLAQTLGAHYLDQFASAANVATHEEVTGPELIHDARRLGVRWDAVVCGAGTGGTLTGIGRTLKRWNPHLKVILADPKGSILAGGEAHPYKVEGIGDDHSPSLYDARLVDDAVTVDDATSFRHALLAARLEGLLVGGSAGCHLAAAAHVARRLPAGAQILVILPDTGRNYVSTFLDPDWRTANGVEVPA
ncbi:MAG: PLP-dependent cysteine synthase family protein [Thermoplasmatota archaeon]